jgi:Patatin-like phospholipase
VSDEDKSKPLTTEQILRAEALEIHGAEKVDAASAESKGALYPTLHKLQSAALCLSGGGIRSAAFALGVIQALAAHPRSATGKHCGTSEDSLLAKFHYLSTVSGGGYIGAWMSAWRTRNDFPTLWACLTGRPCGPDVEPPVLAWLRGYSNYITPKLGLMSADAWTDVALVARNLILNWLIIVPFACAAMLALKIISVASDGATRMNDWRIQIPLAMLGVGFLIAALAFITRHRPSRRGGDEAAVPGVDQATYLRRGLLFSVLAAAFLAQFLASDFVGLHFLQTCPPADPSVLGSAAQLCLDDDGDLVPSWSKGELAWLGALAGGVIYALSWLLARPLTRDLRDFVCWTVAGGACGAAIAFGLFFYLQVPAKGLEISSSIYLSSVVLHIVFGVPWILLSQAIGEMLFAGLSSYGRNSESDREWLARTSGWTLATALAWFLLTFLTFFGAVLVWSDEMWSSVATWLAPLGGISGLLTALLGSSRFSRAQGPAKGAKSFSANLVLSIAAPVFAAALIICLSFALDQLMLAGPLVPDRFDEWENDPAGRLQTLAFLSLGLACFAGIAAAASYFVNINRFSLHALYRNRIVRAFLGASRDRRPDPFTGFDENDNPRMRSLWPRVNPNGTAGDGGWAPFHVVNTTLNIVSAKKLAWQERKATSFTMTPLHCGYSSKCPPGSNDPIGAFRASADYGAGITLGTAIAISGAAASPNMGYHSSPGITFLMTLFNVRLGWWLGNPADEGKDTYTRESPLFAIVPLVQETFGLTTDDKRYIYLSDGGHHDYHAIGEIDYQAADGAAAENGILLYVKAGYHGVEGAGVRSYAMANDDFPHQSTLDQWFSESQFESYRELGLEIMDGILSKAMADATCAHDPRLKTILATLWKLSNAPAVTPPP